MNMHHTCARIERLFCRRCHLLWRDGHRVLLRIGQYTGQRTGYDRFIHDEYTPPSYPIEGTMTQATGGRQYASEISIATATANPWADLPRLQDRRHLVLGRGFSPVTYLNTLPTLQTERTHITRTT